MRQIRELTENQERVWLYLATEALVEDFMGKAAAEGYHWADGRPVEPGDGGFLLGVHRDGTLAHLSAYLWCLSFQCDRQGTHPPPRLDYGRFLAGEEDCTCRKPGMAGWVTE